MVETLQIPVLTTWNGIDLIEEEHPLFSEDLVEWDRGMQILYSRILISFYLLVRG